MDKLLAKNSIRHHYIPRFLLDGFTNSEGLLYIYDKKQNRIIKNPRPPKAVFFENERNTIEIKNFIKTSVIEDDIYSKIDDKASKIIKIFQNEELEKIEFTVDTTAHILYFLISLFWRIPKSDFAANDLLDRAEIIAEGIDTEVLRKDLAFRKLKRVGVVKHHIDEITKCGLKGKRYINIHQSAKDIYVIGDYPILFKRTPSLFAEFNDIDFLIAVSSKRIYSSTIDKFENFSNVNSLAFNAAIIDQSVRYVGCCNYDMLDHSISFYNKLVNQGLIYGITEMAFQTH